MPRPYTTTTQVGSANLCRSTTGRMALFTGMLYWNSGVESMFCCHSRSCCNSIVQYIPVIFLFSHEPYFGPAECVEQGNRLVDRNSSWHWQLQKYYVIWYVYECVGLWRTSSSAIVEVLLCRVGQFWPKYKWKTILYSSFTKHCRWQKTNTLICYAINPLLYENSHFAFLQRIGIASCADSCISHGRLSIRPSFRHIPVFCRDEWRYDHAVFTIR